MSDKVISFASLLDAAGISVTTSTPNEVLEACIMIVDVQSMISAKRDVIISTFESGPLSSGDIVSPELRDILVDGGYIARVVVKGRDGFNACTNRGAWAYRLIKAGA